MTEEQSTPRKRVGIKWPCNQEEGSGFREEYENRDKPTLEMNFDRVVVGGRGETRLCRGERPGIFMRQEQYFCTNRIMFAKCFPH